MGRRDVCWLLVGAVALIASLAGHAVQLSIESAHLFGSTRAGTRQLYVARADGTGAYQVTRLKAGRGAIHGYWRPKP